MEADKPEKRKFVAGQILNCPRDNLPELGEGLRWDIYADQYSWRVVPVETPAEEHRLDQTRLDSNQGMIQGRLDLGD